MIISLNNQITEIAEKILLSEALLEWGFSDTKIAVAINGEFVPRSTYDSRKILASDQIDIVKPVGGG